MLTLSHVGPSKNVYVYSILKESPLLFDRYWFDLLVKRLFELLCLFLSS